MALTFEQARACVLQHVAPSIGRERIALAEAAGRVLAEDIRADRDYPPFPRSARDGFAVRAADLPGELRVIGEVRAGEAFQGSVHAGEALEIMTGAPVPAGADAVVMVEHTTRSGDRVKIERTARSGDNFNPRGVEALEGETVLASGTRLDYAAIALLAATGNIQIEVFPQPRVAIIPTGDELVEIGEQPLAHQIRNSNAQSLAVQVRRAGGIPVMLPIARDTFESTIAAIENGFECDMMLLSGGVSAGKHDLVEDGLKHFGAELLFDRVLIQPGQPLVFGRRTSDRGEQFFFGLPGNPGSTMVTFELFARAAIEKIQGIEYPALPLLRAKLTREFRHKTGLTRFLPACLSADGSAIEPLRSQGSGDVVSLARANAFLVAEPDRESWAAGDDIRVMLK